MICQRTSGCHLPLCCDDRVALEGGAAFVGKTLKGLIHPFNAAVLGFFAGLTFAGLTFAGLTFGTAGFYFLSGGLTFVTAVLSFLSGLGPAGVASDRFRRLTPCPPVSGQSSGLPTPPSTVQVQLYPDRCDGQVCYVRRCDRWWCGCGWCWCWCWWWWWWWWWCWWYWWILLRHHWPGEKQTPFRSPLQCREKPTLWLSLQLQV